MESLKYSINHVFLPPKTPQKDDTNINEEHNLIGSLLNSTKKFAAQCPPTEARQLQAVARMLQRLLTVKSGLGGSEKKASMRQVISELSNGGTSYSCCCFCCFMSCSGSKPLTILTVSLPRISRLSRPSPECRPSSHWPRP